MGKSSGGGGSSTSTSEPPKYLLPFLKQGAEDSQTLYEKGAIPLYPNQMYANLNSTQQGALDKTIGISGQPTDPSYGQSASFYSGILDNPNGQNPYLDQLLAKYGNKANQLVASNFNTAGRYGSGSHAAAAGTAITEATLPVLADQYNKDMQYKFQAAQANPQMAAALKTQQYGDAALAGAAGDTMQKYDQKAIDEAMTRFNFDNGGAEGQVLDDYLRRINSQMQGYGTTTQTTSGGDSGIGSTLGSLVGAGLSYFGFSDERLKEEIKFYGMENGHNLYSFKYKNSPHRYIGVMAQEVLKKQPDAVTTGADGLMTVDYEKIGVRFRLAGASLEEPARAAGAQPVPEGGFSVEQRAPASFGIPNRGL